MKKRKRTEYIWEVYHAGPCGDRPIGFFKKKLDAERAKKNWDVQFNYPSDAANIVRHILY